jgi:hypothetical protein
MNKLLIGLAMVPFLAGVAMAGQPTPLSDAQMDKVTAGAEFTAPGFEYTISGVLLTLQFPGSDPHTSCFGFCGIDTNVNFENNNPHGPEYIVPSFGPLQLGS